MKRLIVLIFTGIIAFQMNVSAQDNYQKELYTRKVASFTKMKNAGVGLTIGGSVLTVVSIAAMAGALDSYNNSDSDWMSESESIGLTLGYIGTVLGISAVSGGTVLWIIGGTKKTKYSQKLNSLSFNINPNPHQTISLVYRF